MFGKSPTPRKTNTLKGMTKAGTVRKNAKPRAMKTPKFNGKSK